MVMYTTIEPRLIALLNNDPPLEKFTASPSLELPPLRDPHTLILSGRPLLLEPGASQSKSTRGTNVSQNASSTSSGAGDDTSKTKEPKRHGKQTERTLGNSSPQSLRKILDDGGTNTAAAAPSKKRNGPDTGKDEFVQLPQPPKKQRAAKQVVPPIINGLYEPPPQTALFPPISSSSFHDSHGRNTLNTVAARVADSTDKLGLDEAPPEVDKEPKPTSDKSKSIRARRKWTEEETKNLLLGASKHGVGNWADILEDTAFTFNNRSGVDLKDRFRTCCPAELWETSSSNSKKSVLGRGKASKLGKSASSLLSENILIEDEELGTSHLGSETSAQALRSSRTHRKKLEDLRELGIERPFRKSQRRERNPFTEEDDRQILEGYNIYGPSWTKIQRDPQFHLQNRQPTDLRDRFRNKHPEKFKADDTLKVNRQVGTIAEDQSADALQSSLFFKGLDSREMDTTAVESPFNSTFGKSENRGKGMPNENAGSSSQGKSDSRENDLLQTTMTANILALNLHPSTSRERLKIQQMISTESQKPQPSLPFTPKDMFTPFEQTKTLESTDDLSYSQNLDWSGSIAVPFSGNIGEMDISRLLMDDSWIVSSTTRDKQNFTDISSIITSTAEPLSHAQSFYNMLDPDQLNNIHTSTSSDHDSSFG